MSGRIAFRGLPDLFPASLLADAALPSP
ncbi:Hypothetical protein SCLAV_1143 [Streptomyces clavuligerus]|uniref:Uncharacterized protein n=1 Tax=Streptomyces clavuligerus TaxID=1901 RepID=E2PYJ9_STRCL|nr:Hypothetical protein SCLAV_1143 [Streptomyces clavuligerus]